MNHNLCQHGCGCGSVACHVVGLCSYFFYKLLPLLEQIVQTGRKLLIIAEDIEGEALTTLVMNKLRGTFTVVGVKSSSWTPRW